MRKSFFSPSKFFFEFYQKLVGNYILFKVIIILFFCVIEISPQFKITEEATNQYSIDPFTKEIYYTEYFEGYQRIISLPDLSIADSPFSGLPHFSKKYHHAAYFDQGKIFFHDFVKDSNYLLYNFGADVNDFSSALLKTNDFNPTGLLFSPNNINLLIDSSPTSYYSFVDSSLHSLETNIDMVGRRTIWSSDSTILFTYSENLFEINIYTLDIDTVVTLSLLNNKITSFDYDFVSNLIIYSELFDSLYSYNSNLHFFNRTNNKDSIVFSIKNTACADRAIIKSIKWNKNNNKIGFLIYHLLDPLTGISFYGLDSAETFEITDCNHYPLKELLNWYNEDTLVYLHFDYDYWNAFQLYGIPIKKITSVRNEINKSNEFLLFGNYPNPFNSQTTIRFVLNRRQEVGFKLYNALGEEILNEFLGELDKGMNEYRLTMVEKSSGIYIYRLIAESGSITGKIILLK